MLFWISLKEFKKVVLRLKTLNIVWKLNDVPFGVCFLLIVCFSFKNKYINANHLCVHDKTIISGALARSAPVEHHG